jgi:hypothetical protein
MRQWLGAVIGLFGGLKRRSPGVVGSPRAKSKYGSAAISCAVYAAPARSKGSSLRPCSTIRPCPQHDHAFAQQAQHVKLVAHEFRTLSDGIGDAVENSKNGDRGLSPGS